LLLWPKALAVDDQWLYVALGSPIAGESTPGLWFGKKDGSGELQRLSSDVRTNAVERVGDWIVYQQFSSFYVAKAGGASPKKVEFEGLSLASLIATDGETAFIMEDSSLCGDGSIQMVYKLDLERAYAKRIARVPCLLNAAAFEGELYLEVGAEQDGPGSIERLSSDGSEREVLATGLAFVPQRGIAVAGDYVYFGTEAPAEESFSTGDIYRVPRDGGTATKAAKAGFSSTVMVFGSRPLLVTDGSIYELDGEEFSTTPAFDVPGAVDIASDGESLFVAASLSQAKGFGYVAPVD
jgi:hypothetical protein